MSTSATAGKIAPDPNDPGQSTTIDVKAIAAQAAEVRRAATPEALLFNYVFNNGSPRERNLPALMKILRTAVQLGHDTWPVSIRNIAQQKHVLHLNCGPTLYGPVFRAMGATSYTGLDPVLAPERKKFRSRIEKKTVGTDFSLVDVIRLMPGTSYMQAEEIIFRDAFDLVAMQTGTQTSASVQTLFAQIHRALRPNGEIWFMHENFYAWSGHQMAPRNPAAFDPNDTEQKAMVDWGHLKFDAPEGHRLRAYNRLTPTELRNIANIYFEVSQWTLVPERSTVAARLTPELRPSLSAWSESDLLTRQIVCRAVKRTLD